MVVPKINSAHGSETRNIINAAIDSINVQGKSIQDLVAEGQLTHNQYATLIQSVNGLISKGNVTFDDIDINKGKLLPKHASEELLSMITGNAPINAVPADGSITTVKVANKAVTPEKTTFAQGLSDEVENIKDLNNNLFDYSPTRRFRFDGDDAIEGGTWGIVDGKAGIDTGYSQYIYYENLIPVKEGDILVLKNWGFDEAYALAFSAYDSSRNPYNGEVARVNFIEMIYDEAEDVYTFTIPSSVFFIGLSVTQPKDETMALLINDEFGFTEKMRDLLSSDVRPTKTADFFQKGASKKNSSKKIGIITAGQSNADGRVPLSQLPSYINNPMTKVKYSEKNVSGIFQPDYAVPSLWGFDTITYHHITQNTSDEIYVMKWAVGGTSIDPTGISTSHWTAEYEELESIDKSLLLKFESLIRACIESKGSEFDVRAMLWHQGEADASQISPVASENYYKNLKNVIEYCRGIVGNKNLPFICGTIPTISNGYDPVIEKALRKINAEDPYFYLVDMNNGTVLDNFHFNAESAEYFGEKVFDYLIDAGVVQGSKLNPGTPW